MSNKKKNSRFMKEVTEIKEEGLKRERKQPAFLEEYYVGNVNLRQLLKQESNLGSPDKKQQNRSAITTRSKQKRKAKLDDKRNSDDEGSEEEDDENAEEEEEEEPESTQESQDVTMDNDQSGEYKPSASTSPKKRKTPAKKKAPASPKRKKTQTPKKTTPKKSTPKKSSTASSSHAGSASGSGVARALNFNFLNDTSNSNSDSGTSGLTLDTPVNANNIDYEAEFQKLLAKPSATELGAIAAPQHWNFITKCAEKGVSKETIDKVATGCVYEPGVINGGEEAPKPTVEICFCFDTTGSMFKCLDELKFKLHQCCTMLLGDLPTIRIAMIAHGDYCDGDIYYVVKKMDFTNDFTCMERFVKGLRGTGGGDPEEAYELALMEAQKLNWSTDNPSCAKVLVVIGDDVPHTEEQSLLKIDWRKELENLKDLLNGPQPTASASSSETKNEEHSFTIYTVQCLNRGAFADAFYQELADKTRGARLQLDRFESMTEVFMGLCYRASTNAQFSAHQHALDKASTSEQPTIQRPEATGAEGSALLDDTEVMKIHNAIHDPSVESVEIQGEKYNVAIGKAGCRFVKVNGITYIEQNKEKHTNYARMAAAGQRVTWCVTSGKWGLIIDNAIVREATGGAVQESSSQTTE